MVVLLAMCLLGASVFVSGGQDGFADGSEMGNWQDVEAVQEVEKKKGGEMLEALLDREEDKCYGRRCEHSEECCKGAACVDIEGVSGTCLPEHGRKKFYQACRGDSDCGAGLSCTDSGNFPPSKTCQLEGGSIVKKGFNDECVSSSECDTDRGLCCQILRRHRMAARRVCHYFLDPKSCVGQFHTDAKELKFVANPFFKARLG